MLLVRHLSCANWFSTVWTPCPYAFAALMHMTQKCQALNVSCISTVQVLHEALGNTFNGFYVQGLAKIPAACTEGCLRASHKADTDNSLGVCADDAVS